MSSPARKRFTRRRARSSCRGPCSKAASKMKTRLFVFDREMSFVCRALCLFASLFLSLFLERATGSDSRTSARSLQEGEVEDGRKSRIPCSRIRGTRADSRKLVAMRSRGSGEEEVPRELAGSGIGASLTTVSSSSSRVLECIVCSVERVSLADATSCAKMRFQVTR